MSSRRKPTPNNPNDLRQRILDYFQTLRVPLSAADLDAVLAGAEKERWTPLELLSHLLGPQADLRRQRAIDRRIREARFRELATLEGFDWQFNAQTIDRVLVETLATGEFIRRGDNLVILGQSGVGKSHIVQAVGRAACAGLPRALHHQRRVVAGLDRLLGRSHASRALAVLQQLRPSGD